MIQPSSLLVFDIAVLENDLIIYFFRFANSSSDSISTIVRDFETACHDHYWLEPIAHYGNTKSLDLRWKLLKLYTDDTYPVDTVFDVNSYTQNAFDYRLRYERIFNLINYIFIVYF
jgi:hypothetical protein